LGGSLIDLPHLEVPAMGQNAPGDTSELVGERDRKHVAVKSPLGGFDPMCFGAGSGPQSKSTYHADF